MQCKLCTFNHSSQDVLLKHYRLHHYRGRSWQQPCVYTECVCTFKTEGALKSHLSRAHRKPVSDVGHFTFKCELCDFKNVCQPSQFIKHLRNHLKTCDTVQCPFKDCNLKTNVLSSFSSHISRKHKSYGFHDFSTRVTCQNPHSEDAEDPQSEDASLELPIPDSQSNVAESNAPETTTYSEPISYLQLELKLASLILYMQTILHVSKSATQEILHWMNDIVSCSKYTAKQSIKAILLKNENHIEESLTEDLAELISTEVLKTNPVLTATADKGSLSTEHKRNVYFKEHFQVVDPVEYCFDRLHPNSFAYVPILKVLEILLSRSDVLEKAVFVEDVPGQYTSTRSGQYYRENQLLGVQNGTISVSLYIDDFEVCNPLGTSRKIHKITAVYWVILNLPAKFRSTLPLIQLALLGKSNDIKQFGYDRFFDPLLKDLNRLEQQGVFVEALKTHLKGTVYCVCADNLGAHGLAGFQESFQAEYLCRFCQVSKKDIQAQDATCFPLRTISQHNTITKELETDPELQTRLGVKRECVLSKRLSFFHPVTGFPPDVLHDTLEGIVPFELSVCLKELIKKGYFDLNALNSRIKSFPYKDSDKVNKPKDISQLSFAKTTIGGNGHENWALLRLLPLLIGHFVPHSEPAWEILMDLREIVELVMSSKFSQETLCYLQRKILEHRQLLQETFPDLKLKPKHHFVEHYPHLIRCFGPLVELWTMRFEAKHSYFKSVVKDARNFKNIPLTLAAKHQLMIAHFLNGPSLFSPPLSVQKVKTVRTCTLEETYGAAVRRKYPNKEVLMLASDVDVCGIHFSEGMILSSGQLSGLPEFFQIVSAIVNPNKLSFLCKRLSSWYNEHYRCYEAFEMSAAEVLEPEDLNDFHPLPLYVVHGKNMIAMVRLRVVLAPDDIRRLDISEVLTSVEQLKDILKEKLEIKDDFVIQFEDPEFGNEVCNLTEITELPPDRAVLKIIQKCSDSDVDTISSLDTASMPSSSSTSTENSPSVSVRQRESSQWPRIFEIPEFAYDVELRLDRANKEFEENGKLLLTMSREMKMEILDSLAQKIFTFTAYPKIQQIESVAAALTGKHPSLKDPGPGSGYHSWTMSIKFKMGNYRQKLRLAGCSEVTVNRKRRRSSSNDTRNFKKAKRGEANFLPDKPTGQTDSSLQQEKEALCDEMKKKNPNMGLVETKMEMTFSLRRKEIVTEEPLVFDVLKQWPALFLPEQISAEFFRITQAHLMNRFFSSLDDYAPKMIKLYRAQTASYGKDMTTLLGHLDDQATGMVAQRKSAALKGLPLVMREDSQKFLRTCLETEPPENVVGGMKMGVLTIVEDDVATVASNPNIRFFSVVLEEQIVVDEVSDLPTAVALLFGLVYALNMEYPKELKYTFEAIQKVFMCLDVKCSARVQSFKNKMLRY